ncbi:MAG: hypothetical protein JWL90_923 [Chthoniobacteraceae bacterium]|nr:hypothetical protein [Chthoniobacteraceae bacterium]
MNALKTSIATLLAIATVQTASADVTIRITGSSAFRAATSAAIKNILTNPVYAYDGSSYSGATHQMLSGTIATLPAAGTVTIKTNWSGSVAGIRDVSQGNNLTFFANDTVLTAAGNNLTGSTSPTANAKLTESTFAEIALADNLQSSTRFTATTLTDAIVGVVPFAFVASNGAPAAVTNITSQLARTTFSTGYASAALFTNNNADAIDQAGGSWIYAAGRDPFSGTRLVALAETGLGVKTALAQYEVTGTISANVVGQIRATLADVPNGVGAGDNGFASGGTLADMMRYTTTSVEDTTNDPKPDGTNRKIAFVSYLGEGDADRAVNGTGSAVTGAGSGNARYLTYNGVSGFAGVRATPTVSTTTASTTLTLTTGTTAGLVAGQAIKGNGIPNDNTIASIVDATHLTLTIAATATASGVTATITNLLPANIRSGAYSFWGYEHILWTASINSDATKLGIANLIKNQITNTDYFNSGIANDSSMRVKRTSDGGTIIGKYY